ncbi:oligosaccharide flippase family protein [Providencia sp. 21OH12SH02B-Prov]|uniref:oligosaccharide flippase family protein n=1 Tax=Providencia sp. 21OH12SH02B-Prov TaxID=3015951 RepID=UPI0022B74372|nr:oligosaccharide flippase family protein [Providencia sp. 21OH12SH02B-Prov]WBA57170.1 oligosaccharide flippase family protein [Providencia sp. 21OH12SH02B-Prov]
MTIKKKLISNFSYLSIIQIVTLLIPFIYYPYIIRKFSIDSYGLVIFIQSIIMLMSIIVDFGFNIYGTRIASENSNSKKKLSIIYSSITYIKLLLVLISFLIFQFFIYFNSKLNENHYLSNILFFIVLGEALFSQWLYLGLEKIKYAALINLFSRLCMLLIIFIGSYTFIGFYSFPLALVFSSLINGILSLWFFNIKLKLKFVPVSFKRIKKDIKESYSFLLSRSIGVIILKLNTYLIGNYIGFAQVAYYDLAEKLINLALMPINLLNQVLYPYIAKTKNFGVTFSTIKYLIVIYLLTYPILLLFGKDFIILFAGDDMAKSYTYLLILYFIPLLNIFSYFLGNCALVLIDRKKDFNNSIYIAAFFYITFILFMSQFEYVTISTLCWAIVLNAFITSLYRILKCIKYKNLLKE